MNPLDQIAQLMLGHQGNTQAHLFLERVARIPLQSAANARYRAHGNVSIFIPPKQEERVLRFEDESYLLVQSDGFCLPWTPAPGEIEKGLADGTWTQER